MRTALPLCLLLLVPPLAGAGAGGPDPRSAHRTRHGGTFHDDYLLGKVSGPTIRTMMAGRMLTWRSTEPFHRVRNDHDLLAHDKDWRIRRAAVQDLAHYPSERTEESLVRALRDPTLAVRSEAARQLGRVGTHRAVPALIDALSTSPGPVRDELAFALMKLTGEDYGRHQDRWRRWFEANRGRLR